MLNSKLAIKPNTATNTDNELKHNYLTPTPNTATNTVNILCCKLFALI